MVAKKQVVYETFPIPLINRLEKHFLRIESLLTDEQNELVTELQTWMTRFATLTQG